MQSNILFSQPSGFQQIKGCDFLQSIVLDQYEKFLSSWQRLPIDPYLPHYALQRFRRYSRLIWQPADNTFTLLADNNFFQSKKNNYLYGGINRKFFPIEKEILYSPLLNSIIRYDFNLLSSHPSDCQRTWQVGIHQITVLASEKAGIPAPEGIHQDGHQYLAMHLIKRHNILGGISSFYDLKKTFIGYTALTHPFDSILLDDTIYLHAVSRVFARDKYEPAYRYMLLIDYE